MKYRPEESFLQPIRPEDVPGLVCFWDFQQGGECFPTSQGYDYRLQSKTGALECVEDATAPFDGKALRIGEGDWLNLPRAECPELDFHGEQSAFTLIAWLKRSRKSMRQCEFIAGQWNETHLGRQYGLFIDIPVWGAEHRVFGHLSKTGGATPGYQYCMDGPMSEEPVPWDEWCMIGMSYDGVQGFAWMNGMLQAIPGLNPYSLAGGLHHSGPLGSDFTVAAVDRSGEMGNFFCGLLSALAVYRQALSPAEVYGLSRCGNL